MTTADLKKRFLALRLAMRDFAETPVREALHDLIAADATVHLCHPWGDVTGPDALYDQAYAPLLRAIPDLERRDWIVMAGIDQDGALWVGAGGHYIGTFAHPWLDIPPTGHLVSLRFHEYYRFDGDRVVEMQALWDVPEVMMQAGVWPIAPSLGRELRVPGPASSDGLDTSIADPALTAQSMAIVTEMLTAMMRHPSEGGPEVMQMDRFWSPRMNWYGPAGIGAMRGIRGFRNWHQIPFLNAMPDRGQRPDLTYASFFAEGSYVAVCGHRNMAQTIVGPGWLGIAPTGQLLRLCSFDFWRVEDGLIRENWVLIDLLDVFAQLGMQPLDRMREFNKARVGFDPETGRSLT
jgi:predicted ester cyclase